MDLWPKYYHGPRQAITVLHRSVFKLSRAGTFISRHRTVQGAILAAQYHADQLDAVGVYRIRVQTGLLLEFEVVPRSDIDILFSDGQPINAYPAGAKTSGATSGVSASQDNNDAQAGITGAAGAGAAGIASPDTFVLYTVPNITLLPGATVDMSQYWNDPLGDVTTSEITNLDTAVATYSHPTLTGVGVGISNTLTLEVSTVVAHGDSYTVTGSGFGTKATAAPVLSDQFESGAVGAALATPDIGTADWQPSPGFDEYKYSDEDFYSGSQSIKADFTSSPSVASIFAEYKALGGINEFYLSYYTKYNHLSGAVSRNYKFARVTRGFSGGYLQPSMGYTQFYFNNSRYYYFGNNKNPGFDFRPSDFGPREWDLSSSSLTGSDNPDADDLISGQWHRIEYYVKIGDTDTANGAVAIWKDHSPLIGSVGVVNKDSNGEGLNYEWLTLPYYVADDPGGHYEIFNDDVYLDSTIQHVEIGDSATFTSCTIREVQRATAWADGEITITVNKGGLSPGTNHVHVVTGLNTSGMTTVYAGTIDIT